ncbi:hypothetical protein FC18_GL000152 [Lacticaseibacillus sharpeae JCM 1186 = DSM 20505]|uniref:Uncharacterized protein n=1 Tax=Lacticaseibacillus sharpeae JCM 1186 = DSM 20505 TaxID=1291052 RepID=A0A0R1ZMF0_9LACO|nr:hypothetical protein FC18_GL000152 [Lacticaseibacillus sharpeae JCM 1186 = DSM 20505]
MRRIISWVYPPLNPITPNSPSFRHTTFTLRRYSINHSKSVRRKAQIARIRY